MKRGIVVGVGVAVVAAIAWWWLRGNGAPQTAQPESTRVVSAKVDPQRPFLTPHARHIAGMVIMDGQPVVGAAVALTSSHQATTRAVTDANGHFDLGPQPTSKSMISASAPHVTAAVEELDGSDVVDNLVLVLHPCEASIHGTIRDVGGGVLAGARVTRSTFDIGVTSGADGSYDVCVPVSGDQLIVQADGYARAMANVSAYGRVRRDFVLSPEAIVSGRVVRADTRAPIEGAVVEVKNELDHVKIFATSGPDGTFALAGVMPGRVTISAHADHLAMRPLYIVARIAPATESLVCALAAAHTIRGTLVDRDTKAPVGSALLQIYGSIENRIVTSSVDGRFEVIDLPSGDYKPVLGAQRLDDHWLLDDKDLDVILEVAQPGSISGRVLRDGKPVDGASVQSRPGSEYAESDHEGRYTLRGLAPGEYTVYAESKRVHAFTNGPKVTLANKEQRVGVDVNLELSGSISGTVVDQNDVPVSGALLELSLLHGTDRGTATTADDGSFTANTLSGGGDYLVQVRQSEASEIPLAPAVGKRFPTIALHDGDSHVTGVRIRARLDKLAITGRVVDAANNPVPDVVVTATGLDHASAPTVTDSAGAFELRDLRTGNYTLATNAIGGTDTLEPVPAGRSGVVIHVLEAGGIDGVLEGFKDILQVWAEGPIEDGVFEAAIDGNTFHLRNLPPKAYTITVTTRTIGGRANAKVTSGSITTITLRAPPLGTVVGTAVPNANCHMWGPRVDPPIAMPPSVSADANGRYRIANVPVGAFSVGCANESASGTTSVTVVANSEVRADVAMVPSTPRRTGHIGMTIERQFDELIVRSVEPAGAAARAGILVGDVITTVDDLEVAPYSIYDLRYGAPGRVVKLGIERDDKPLEITVTFD